VNRNGIKALARQGLSKDSTADHCGFLNGKERVDASPQLNPFAEN